MRPAHQGTMEAVLSAPTLGTQTAEARTTRKDSDPELTILNRAVAVIGNKDRAMRWMGTPVRALEYATPVSLILTAKGRKAVLAVLDRLEHGVL
jgi:putative toxin-antitoxin system antitoxin component (TIGR02293 family)